MAPRRPQELSCHTSEMSCHVAALMPRFIRTASMRADSLPRLQAYGCTEKQLKRLQRVCGIRESARPLDRQYLFNVYTHPSSSYKGATLRWTA